MARPRRPVKAFTLLEVLLALLLLTVAGLVLTMLNDVLYVHRTAAAHLDRMAAIDGLTRTLRRDVLGAVAYRCETPAADEGSGAATLVLETVSPNGRDGARPLQDPDRAGARPLQPDLAHKVRYVIGRDAVARVEAGAETHVWKALRLEFAGRLERGPHADVFYVDFTEQPPPRARTSLPRSSALSVLLPGRVGDDR
jgi:hypothetical protein